MYSKSITSAIQAYSNFYTSVIKQRKHSVLLTYCFAFAILKKPHLWQSNILMPKGGKTLKASLQTIHCVLENNPAWTVIPLPYEKGSDSFSYPAEDWEPLLKQYQKGDKRFFHLLCCKSGPLVNKISRKQYFAHALGQDEAYSIAAMSMVNYWARLSPTEEIQNIPGQLYHSMECDLRNQINRQKTRCDREIHYETKGETEGNEDEWQEPLADCRQEPEQQALQAEWNHKVRDCLQYLGKKEQQVIHSFFFRQLSVTEIAQEMHCTPACVSATKRNALYKLRRIFETEQVLPDLAQHQPQPPDYPQTQGEDGEAAGNCR